MSQDPNSLDAYLARNYLLMNLLVEEDCDENKLDYYAKLLKQSFDVSYEKFSKNPEYLFFTGITAFMSEWYFDIDIEDARAMIIQAQEIEPSNIFYKWGCYTYGDMRDQADREKARDYAQIILDSESNIQFLDYKGALGKYVLGIMQSQTAA